jgi:hypothetical protein
VLVIHAKTLTPIIPIEDIWILFDWSADMSSEKFEGPLAPFSLYKCLVLLDPMGCGNVYCLKMMTALFSIAAAVPSLSGYC